MEKEFVPYDLALKLHQLGFEDYYDYDRCFGFYTEEYKKLVIGFNKVPINLPTKPFIAPLWHQAFSFIQTTVNIENIGLFLSLIENDWVLFNDGLYWENEEALKILIQEVEQNG